MATTCNICIEKYNRSTRKPIECLHCKFDACVGCVARVICDSPNAPRCMNCNKEWNLDFLIANFTKKFMNETLKHHRENQLFEREVAMLPITQPVVERTLETRKHEETKRALLAERARIRQLYNNINEQIDDINAAIGNLACGGDGGIEKKAKREFIRKCPFEGCRGFLSTAWKCGICENYTCKDCLEVKGHNRENGDNHVCNPENIETARLLAADTKPCPSCGELINKIDGCNQMFCTMCHAVWNWNTGRIETGTIHNPHFFEYQRLNGGGALPRPIGDVPCGGMPHVNTINNGFVKVGGSVHNLDGYSISTFVRLMNHMHQVTREQYIVNNLTDNVDLRIKYMLKEIDEKHFKMILQQREKSRNKKREIEQVLSMTYTVACDIIRRMMQANSHNDLRKGLEEIKNLLAYSEESMDKIKDKYNCVVPSMVFDFKRNHAI